jgi:hypothetical protein
MHPKSIGRPPSPDTYTISRCEQCDVAFETLASHLRKGRSRFCSTDCWYTFRRNRPLADRIWARGKRTGDCLDWTGALSPSGYGKVRISNKTTPVHRVSWELTYGPIPAGLWVLHKCDRRVCFRPEHLFLGTPRDNMQDMIAKDRGNRHREFTDATVAAIRERYATGNITQAALAREFGMSPAHVCNILKGKDRPLTPIG